MGAALRGLSVARLLDDGAVHRRRRSRKAAGRDEHPLLDRLQLRAACGRTLASTPACPAFRSTISAGRRHATCAEPAFRNRSSWSLAGWRTNGVFRRYTIVNRNDLADAMRKLEQSQQRQDQ